MIILINRYMSCEFGRSLTNISDTLQKKHMKCIMLYFFYHLHIVISYVI